MNVVLWVGQGILAVVFGLSGALKATRSKQWLLASGQTGVRDLELPVIRAVAACELAGVLGLVLPWSSRVLPGLTPAAAAGLALVMVGATRIHARLGESRNVAVNVILLVLCVTVCLGRGLELTR
jgi:TctA family transporter